MEKPDYELTEKQKKFVRKAKRLGYKVDYGYSGRSMYGQKCPSVVLDDYWVFKTYSVDNMGRQYVVYCP